MLYQKLTLLRHVSSIFNLYICTAMPCRQKVRRGQKKTKVIELKLKQAALEMTTKPFSFTISVF